MLTVEMMFGFPDYRDAWALAGVAAAVALVGLGLLAQRRRSRRRRERDAQAGLARQLASQDEAERQKLAREIQNGFGHRLVLLRNAALSALAQPGSPKAAHEELDHIATLATNALEDARGLAERLRPVELDRRGFEKAVEELLARHLAPAGIRVFKDLDNVSGAVSNAAALFLYRLVEALVREVIARAGVTTVLFEAKVEPERIRLRLEHDGPRSEPGIGAAPAGEGEGLSGIAERVRLLGGEFRGSALAGSGTCWQILIPRVPPDREGVE